MNDFKNQYPDRISEMFKNRTILITGGTGFVGKVLIEKLLRCSDLRCIYLLIRPKKNEVPNTRLIKMLQSPLYNLLRKEKSPAVFKKVLIINGDVSAENLGISKSDRTKLINEVEFIFHLAATVRFDEPIKTAVILNVRGTKLLLELAHQCKNLLTFNHVSTAYSQVQQRILYEKAYQPTANPHQVIANCEQFDEETISKTSKTLLAGCPNGYVFTKALSESLVNEQMDSLPVIITRPSVVIPIWWEPLPGWSDNLNGPSGLLIAAGKGILRTMYCKGDAYLDYIPVDVLVSGILVSTSDFYVHKSSRRYFNLTSSHEFKVSFNQMIKMGKEIVTTEYPFQRVLWYPGGSTTNSRVKHYVVLILFQFIPAVLVDTLIVLFGFKPLLVRAQKKIFKGCQMLEYFANNQWDFNNTQALKGLELLNPRERIVYKLDSDGLDLKEYFKNAIHASRLYLLKESDDTLPASRIRIKVLWFLDILLKAMFTFWMLHFIWKNVLTN